MKKEERLKKDRRVFSYITTKGKKYGVNFYRTINGRKVPLRHQGFDTSADAIEWANTAEREATLHSGVAKRVTVQEYFNIWMKRNEEYWSPDTYHDYDQKFNRYLLPKFGNTLIQDVTREDFQEYINELEHVKRSAGRTGYSSKTISILRGYMSTMLNDAVYSGIIPSNKLRNLRIKSGIGVHNNDISRKKYIQAVKTAKEVLSPMALGAFALSLIALRHGEIIAMQPKSIFSDHVHVGIARTNWKPEGGKTKTPASVRDVPITANTYEVLQNAVKFSRQLYLDNSKEFTSDSFIFVTENATPWNYTRLNHIFNTVSEAMGQRVGVYNTGNIFVDDKDNHRVMIRPDKKVLFKHVNGKTDGNLNMVKIISNIMGEMTGAEVLNKDGSKVVVNLQVDIGKAQIKTVDSHGKVQDDQILPEGKNVLITNDAHLFPHMMRHAFATFSIPDAKDPIDVMKIMGHSDFRMTQYYDNGTSDGRTNIINMMDKMVE